MALTVAAIFYVVSRRFPVLLRHAGPVGLLYRLAVFVVNNFGTAPLLSWFRSLYLHTPVLLTGRWDCHKRSFTCSVLACLSRSWCVDTQESRKHKLSVTD